jgi:uncharacterized phage-associated protein
MVIPYQKEKIENAICFFAKEHKKRTKKPLSQTALYKYLALFEFEIFEETGRPPLNLIYKAMDYGPVPIEIYNKRDEYESELFRFKKIGENEYIIIPLKKPNLDYFSEYEIEKLKNLVYIYGEKFVTTSIMSDVSHQKIKAWKKAYTRQKNSIINYEDTFEDLEHKDIDKLSFAEENYLIWKNIDLIIKEK